MGDGISFFCKIQYLPFTHTEHLTRRMLAKLQNFMRSTKILDILAILKLEFSSVIPFFFLFFFVVLFIAFFCYFIFMNIPNTIAFLKYISPLPPPLLFCIKREEKNNERRYKIYVSN